VTLEELAASDFDPDTDYIGKDRMPPGWRPRWSQAYKPEFRCEVSGCGVRYALNRVCGYCRARVRLLRGE
jgi:hypothetical protein